MSDWEVIGSIDNNQTQPSDEWEEVIPQADKMGTLDGIDRITSSAEIGARKTLYEPLLGVAGLSEAVANQVRNMFGFEDSDAIQKLIDENRDIIEEKQSELGYKKGDIITPANASELATNIALTLSPFAKSGQVMTRGQVAGRTAVQEGAVEATQSKGRGDTSAETALKASIASTLAVPSTYVAFKIGDVVSRMGNKDRSLLLDRMKDVLNISNEEEAKYVSKYAEMIGKDPSKLDAKDRVTALAYGNPKAQSFLQSSMTKDQAIKHHSQFNEFAKDLSKRVENAIDASDEVAIQSGIKEVTQLLSDGWDDYRKVTDIHYGDVFVDIPRSSELNKTLLTLAKNIENPVVREQLYEGKMGLNSLLDMKQILGELTFNKIQKPMTKIEKLEHDQNVKLYNTIVELYKDAIPSDLKKTFESLNKLQAMKSQANVKQLFSRFIKEDTNIEFKHVEDIIKEMSAVRKGSSYDSFIRLMGKKSEVSNNVERTLVSSLFKKNNKNGFTDFAKLVDNLDELNFKTPQGRALKELIGRYKDVFGNIGDFKLTGLRSSDSSAGLTNNMMVSLQYLANRVAFNRLTDFVGATTANRSSYIIRKLPEVLDMKSMPKNFTLKEQKGAIAFSRFVNGIRKMSSVGAEELELGEGNYYPTSQMIGEEGAKNLPQGKSVAQAKEIFTGSDIANRKAFDKTGWMYDNVDDKWKFHMDGKDVKFKVGKGVFTRSGTHKLEDLVSMPELFEAYPDLKNTKVHFTSMTSDAHKGWYNPSTGEIGINKDPNAWTMGGKTMVENIKSTLAHEIQHSIQKAEDFAGGGSPEQFQMQGMSRGDAFRNYQSLHGEVEARALTKGANGEYPQDIYNREYQDNNLIKNMYNRGAGTGRTIPPK